MNKFNITRIDEECFELVITSAALSHLTGGSNRLFYRFKMSNLLRLENTYIIKDQDDAVIFEFVAFPNSTLITYYYVSSICEICPHSYSHCTIKIVSRTNPQAFEQFH